MRRRSKRSTARRLQDIRTFGKRKYVTVTNSQADSLQGSFGSSNGVAILIRRRCAYRHAMTYRPNTLPRGYRASEPLGSLCCRPDLRPFLLLFRFPSFDAQSWGRLTDPELDHDRWDIVRLQYF